VTAALALVALALVGATTPRAATRVATATQSGTSHKCGRRLRRCGIGPNPFREFDTEPRRDLGASPRHSPPRLNVRSASPTARPDALPLRWVDGWRKATVVLSGGRRYQAAPL
jgi:hypothetical protein